MITLASVLFLAWHFGAPGATVDVTIREPATLLFAGSADTYALAFSPAATRFLVKSTRVPGLPGDELLYAQATTPRADGVRMELGLVSRSGGELRTLLPRPFVIAFPELEAVCVDTRGSAALPVTVLQRDPEDGIPCICWPHRVRMTRYRLAHGLLTPEKALVTDRPYRSALDAARAGGVACDLNLTDLGVHAQFARPASEVVQ